MLRSNLPPIDTYLADAMSMTVNDFIGRYQWPMLVIPEPDPKIMTRLRRQDTLIDQSFEDVTRHLDPLKPSMVGASLDALVLELRPKRPGRTDRVTIGRSPESDVVLIDESVSRQHSELYWNRADEEGIIRDCGSRNGTKVDGAPVPSRGEVALVSGAVLTFGSLVTRYYVPRSFMTWLQSGAPRSGAAPADWPRR